MNQQSPTVTSQQQQQQQYHHHQQQAAPIRCFFDDIPNVVTSHQQKQQQKPLVLPVVTAISDITTMEESMNENRPICNKTNTNTNNNRYDPSMHPITKRRKITIEQDATVPSTLWLRLLGTVVHVSTLSSTPCDANSVAIHALNRNYTAEQEKSNYHTFDQSITLDDGTDMIVVYVTLAMIQQIHIQNGMILDCIVRVEMLPNLHYNNNITDTTITSKNNNQSVSVMENIRLIANQITIQDSTKETLRWLELSYQTSMMNTDQNHDEKNHTDDWDMKLSQPSSSSILSSSPTTTTASTTTAKSMKYHVPQSSKWMGYPTRDVTAEDIYRIIASECETYNDEIYITAQNINNNNDTNDTKTGVSLQDLSDCFQSDIHYITKLIQELQHSGQIYQNEKGLYTLL